MPKGNLTEQIQMRMQLADEEQLYESIARSLPAKVSQQIGGGAALRLKSPVQFGKEIYQKFVRPSLHTGICGKAQFCKRRKTFETAAKVTSLVAGFAAEVVTAQFGLVPGAGAGATLVVDISAAALKEGLNKLCECK